jgi:chaperone modulatory protein CbpM
MITEVWDWYSHDVHHRVGPEELAYLAGVSVAELDELVADGSLVPLPGEAYSTQQQFSANCVGPLREAMRLRDQHHLERPVVRLLLGYLLRIAQLEQQLRSLHGQPSHPQHLPREGPTPWREPHA